MGPHGLAKSVLWSTLVSIECVPHAAVYVDLFSSGSRENRKTKKKKLKTFKKIFESTRNSCEALAGTVGASDIGDTSRCDASITWYTDIRLFECVNRTWCACERSRLSFRAHAAGAHLAEAKGSGIDFEAPDGTRITIDTPMPRSAHACTCICGKCVHCCSSRWAW